MSAEDNLARILPEAEDRDRSTAPSIRNPLIITRDAKMGNILKMAQVVALHDTPVLVEGASGTGKELLARYIHVHSSRAAGPFVAVNCAAIPDNLLESELFGYEKGAFTGAHTSRPGKFEQADGGTILLDEISELAPSLQVKLLRVLQEYEVDRLGGGQPVKVNIRVIATSNRSLKKLAIGGAFREDLFYRINVFPLRLTPLRERLDDLEELVPHFVAKYNGQTVKEVDGDVYDILYRSAWRGNIRELENVMARAVVLSHDADRIQARHVVFDGVEDESGAVAGGATLEDGITLREMEKRFILQTLRRFGGNRTHASKALSISIRTLRNKLNEYRKNGELTEASELGG